MKAQFILRRPALANVLLRSLLYLTVLASFVPLNPNLPESGIDHSWIFAMNQAVAQGLVFGKDIIFTYGPYASIFTEAYHPATDRLMVLGSLYLGLCYATAFLYSARGAPLRWILLFAVFLAGYSFYRDALILSYPLLVALAVNRIMHGTAGGISQSCSKEAALLAFLFTPLGLLPIIKGSFLLISGATSVLCFLMLWYSKRRVLASASLVLPFASMVILWLFTGQPISALPTFFANMAPIISGYTEAMAISGLVSEVIIYIAASVMVLFVVGTAREAPVASRLFLFFTFAAFLFVAFKSGFVRHDAHAVTAGTAIVIAAILLNIAVRHKYLNVVSLISAFVWVCIDNAYMHSSPASFYADVKATYANAFDGLAMRLSDEKSLHDAFYKELGVIKEEYSIAPMSGTTDIYSYNQSYLLASENRWSPRPVIQSYSVYTPGLARLNASHLVSEQAPDNVIFKIEPIDRRLPSLEDGLSWPVLIENYSPTKLERDFLYLTKNKGRSTAPTKVEVLEGISKLGREFPMPLTATPLFAELDIRPTLIGRLISFLYKPQLLEVTIELMNGRSVTYGIVSAMAKSGFLISPLVENTTEFALIFADGRYFSDKLVKSIRVSPRDGSSMFWSSEYTIKLNKYERQIRHDVIKLVNFDQIQAKIPEFVGEPHSVNCEGNIDIVNGASPAPPSVKTSNFLSIDGWLAISGKDAVLPDAAFVTLTSESGYQTYIKARRTPRMDVQDYFKQPDMADAGYRVFVDVSKLKGNFSVGLARMYEGRLERCKEFNLPLYIE